jgi:cation/acetate symporter
MLLNVLVATAVAACTPAPPADVQRLVERIRVPRGTGEAR